VGFLLVPLFVSAVFFLAVFLRDLRGDFRERTHHFEDLDPWESPPRETRLAGGGRHQALDFIQRNLVWWLALPASVAAVLSLLLTLPYLLTFLLVCGFILSLVVFGRTIGVGLVAVTVLTMTVALGMLSGQVIRTERHWSEPCLTLMVIPFRASWR